MAISEIKDPTYFELNNKINIPDHGKIPLQYDKEAIKAFFAQNVEPNLKRFPTLEEKIQFLLDNRYLESEFIKKYQPNFLKKLFKLFMVLDLSLKALWQRINFSSNML